MKNLFFIAILALAAGFSACGKKEMDIQPVKSTIQPGTDAKNFVIGGDWCLGNKMSMADEARGYVLTYEQLNYPNNCIFPTISGMANSYGDIDSNAVVTIDSLNTLVVQFRNNTWTMIPDGTQTGPGCE